MPCLSETLGQLLDAHEQAFAYFGGHAQEHLYDRPRTVCEPRGTGGCGWNTTFKASADFWGFEPRLCRAYRAQTKGKVESGVKYFKRNFLAGRRFRDDLDLQEQLEEWTATVADVRVHGTTHERPIDRFGRERDALVPAPAGRAFRLDAPLTRVVAPGCRGRFPPAPASLAIPGVSPSGACYHPALPVAQRRWWPGLGSPPVLEGNPLVGFKGCPQQQPGTAPPAVGPRAGRAQWWFGRGHRAYSGQFVRKQYKA